MAQKIVSIIIYFIKELLGEFLGSVGTPGTIVDSIQNSVEPASFTDQVKEWCKAHGYEFNNQFMRIQLRNPADPNTFNDWGLMFAAGKWVKWRNTCSGGNWTPAQKKKHGIKWVAEWVDGYYDQCFALTRDGVTRFTRLGMPAFWNCRKVTLRNLETGELQQGMNCDEHGRNSTSESVNLSSAGCLTTANGKKIYKIDEFFKTSQLYQRDRLHARWGIIVTHIENFPSIKGVKAL